LKVLLISNVKFRLPETASAYHQLQQYLIHIQRLGVIVNAFIADSGGMSWNINAPSAIRNFTYRLPRLIDDANLLYYPLLLRSFYKLGNSRVSVVHHFVFITNGTNSFSLGPLISDKISKPLVIGPAQVAHDYGYDDFRLYIGGHNNFYNYLSFNMLQFLKRFAHPLLSDAFRRTLDAADCIVVPNQAARRVYSNYVSSKKLKVIPTGTRSFSYVERDPAHYPLILMIGNLIARKGYLVALEAMKKLLIEVPDAQLFILGSGPLQQIIQWRVKKLGVERSIVLKGRASDNELESLLAKAWVFCHASFSEGYSSTIPEAMSAGLPVVCTEIDGSDGMVVNGLNGLVVQPGDPDALAEALAEIISNRELALKMGELSKLRSKSYDWRSVSKEYYYVYQKLSGDT